MAFITGLILIDAPASALNNAGLDQGGRTENAVRTKTVRGFPYVSAQAVRYWWRTTLEQRDPAWRAAPIYREGKVAYTDADPIKWWDDDLFGYMRAPSKKGERAAFAGATPVSTEITRVSPLRVSTFVGLQRGVEEDFGTMARQDGDAVPHQHEFYRTVLRGALSLDLDRVGTFTYRERTGYRNLDEVRRQEAQEAGLEHREAAKEYRLSKEERSRRVASLLRGLGVLAGGAKQSIHYTDVTPVVLVLAVVAGGNNPLSFLVGMDGNGRLEVNPGTVEEFTRVWHDQVLSPVYAGWVQGFHDAARERLWSKLEELAQGGGLRGVVKGHPREVLEVLIRDLEGARHGEWLA